MPKEPTIQQSGLQQSCPHQNWLEIDLSKYDYCVRRSLCKPGEAEFVSEIEPTATRLFNRPTPALNYSWGVARAYKEHGYKVVKDMQYGVHQLSKPGEPTFYLFIEHQEKDVLRPLPVHATKTHDEPRSTAISEHISINLRVEKRMMKVLKAFSELRDQPVSELLEQVVAHSLAGTPPFTEGEQEHLLHFKRIYGACDDA